MELGVPFHRAIGLRVDHLASASSRVALRLRARRGNLNVGGTVHGTALTTLAVVGSYVLRQRREAR